MVFFKSAWGSSVKTTDLTYLPRVLMTQEKLLPHRRQCVSCRACISYVLE